MFDVDRLAPRMVQQAEEWLEVRNKVEAAAGSNAALEAQFRADASRTTTGRA